MCESCNKKKAFIYDSLSNLKLCADCYNAETKKAVKK